MTKPIETHAIEMETSWRDELQAFRHFTVGVLIVIYVVIALSVATGHISPLSNWGLALIGMPWIIFLLWGHS